MGWCFSGGKIVGFVRKVLEICSYVGYNRGNVILMGEFVLWL